MRNCKVLNSGGSGLSSCQVWQQTRETTGGARYSRELFASFNIVKFLALAFEFLSAAQLSWRASPVHLLIFLEYSSGRRTGKLKKINTGKKNAKMNLCSGCGGKEHPVLSRGETKLPQTGADFSWRPRSDIYSNLGITVTKYRQISGVEFKVELSLCGAVSRQMIGSGQLGFGLGTYFIAASQHHKLEAGGLETRTVKYDEINSYSARPIANV